MLDIHIDDFCKDSAHILKLLYESFPCNSDLLVEQIIGPDELDDFGLHSRRHQACLASMLWMAEEGLIRYGGLIQQDGIDQAILTNKAFSLLCSASNIPLTEEMALPLAPPGMPDHGSIFITQIHRLIPDQSSQKLRALMLHFLEKHARNQTSGNEIF